MHDLIQMPASGSLTEIDAEPAGGKTKTGRFWRYAGDRPWTESSHPGAAYVYSEDRRGQHAIRGDASK